MSAILIGALVLMAFHPVSTGKAKKMDAAERAARKRIMKELKPYGFGYRDMTHQRRSFG